MKTANALLIIVLFPAASLGWQRLPGTALLDQCPSYSKFGGTDASGYYWGAEGCTAVIDDWNSGAFDSKRNRLILWGGGHNGYYGNELYALDLAASPARMVRLNDPGRPPAPSGTCVPSIVNGTQPNSRHIYGGITYVPTVDKLFIVSGGMACAAGEVAADTWLYSFQTGTWQRTDTGASIIPPGWTARQLEGTAADFDPVTGLVFVDNQFGLYTYDVAANTYTPRNVNTGGYYGRWQGSSCIIDPIRRYFYCIGEGDMWRWNISNIAAIPDPVRVSWSGSGAIVNGYAPGLAWDSAAQQVVGWVEGGSAIYRLNAANNNWSAVAITGQPTVGTVQNGIYRRFAYSPASNAFVVVNDARRDAWLLRLSPNAAPARPKGLALR